MTETNTVTIDWARSVNVSISERLDKLRTMGFKPEKIYLNPYTQQILVDEINSECPVECIELAVTHGLDAVIDDKLKNGFLIGV